MQKLNLLLKHLLNPHKGAQQITQSLFKRKCSQHQKGSPEDGVIGQLTEAFAHTCCTAQILLQQVREDL